MLPYLAVVLAALCFGTTGTAQAFGPADASASSIGAARILIGGTLLAAVALIAHRRRRAALRASHRYVFGEPRPTVVGRLTENVAVGGPAGAPRRVPGWALVAIGGLGVLAYQPAFFLGTSLNGVAVGTVVALGSAPILTGLLDWLLKRRFPGMIWLVATLIATAGVVLISGLLGQDAAATAGGASDAVAGEAGEVAGAAGAAAISLPGLLASVGAGASYAVYTLASKALLDRGWAPTSAMGAVFGLAAALSIPLLVLSDTSWLATGPGLAMALWLGVATTAVAYLLFGWGLKRLPAATVSTLTLSEPLTATLLGTIVLGETLSPMAVVGLVVLAIGLVVLTIPRRRPPGRAAAPEPPRAGSVSASS